MTTVYKFNENDIKELIFKDMKDKGIMVNKEDIKIKVSNEYVGYGRSEERVATFNCVEIKVNS